MLFVYISLGALIGILETRRHLRGQPIDAMTAFNLSYFVLFVLVPLNVRYFGEDVVRQKYAYEIYGSGDISTALSLFFAYVLFCLGYWWKGAKDQKIRFGRENNSFSLRDSANVAKVIFFIGVFLTVIYVIQIGGVFKVISEATAVRYGEIRLEGKYVFYRSFSEFSADAFVLFFAIVFGKRARKIKVTTGEKAFLLCALLFFVYYAFSTAGRRPFIYPMLLCILVYWSLEVKIRKTVVAALVLVFVIAGLGTILGPIVLSGHLSTALDLYKSSQDGWLGIFEIIYYNASQGSADSYIHFVGAQKASLWQFGFLTDIVNLPRDFFPSRLFGFERTLHMYGQTTEFFTGQPAYLDMLGIEPLGLHGYLLVNFGYPGMFVAFLLLGSFYKWIDTRFKPAEPKDAVGWLIYWWFVLGFFVYFREGALILVLKEQLTWWLITAVLFYYRANRRARMLRLGARVLLASHH